MDRLGPHEIVELIQNFEPPCVSIFLPTHAASEQGQQDAVRLENLLNDAERLLDSDGMRSADAKHYLQPVRNLVNTAEFWKSREGSMAIFIDNKGFHRYRLPIDLDEMLRVDRRFHIKPLLELLHGDGRFFILSLSQNKVQLFDASRHAITKTLLSRGKVYSLPRNQVPGECDAAAVFRF